MDTSDLKMRLLEVAQRDFPLTPRPYATLARRLRVAEDAVVAAFREMTLDDELISRIGAVYRTGTVGASCLAAWRCRKI